MSKRMSRFPTDCKVYVGDLGNNARKQDLEDAFGYYGQLRNVWVARNPPGFAFVEFEDARDAEDSVRGLDGRSICNRKIRVELSTCKNGRGGYRSNMSRRNNGRPFNPDDRCYDCGDRGHYARDCRKKGGRGRGRRSRTRSRSRSRDRRTRSRSGTRSRSRSVRRSASPASARNGHSRSKSFNRSPRIERTKSPISRSRSRSYDNGKF